MNDEYKDILGYGQKVKVMIGKNGKDASVEEFHFTPVSLRDMPILQEKLNVFFELMDKKETLGDEKLMKCAAEIIEMSMKKMHPDVTVEKILEMFSLGGIAKVINIVMDTNDFFGEMGKIQQQASQFQKPLST